MRTSKTPLRGKYGCLRGNQPQPEFSGGRLVRLVGFSVVDFQPVGYRNRACAAASVAMPSLTALVATSDYNSTTTENHRLFTEHRFYRKNFLTCRRQVYRDIPTFFLKFFAIAYRREQKNKKRAKNVDLTPFIRLSMYWYFGTFVPIYRYINIFFLVVNIDFFHNI